MEQRNCKVKEGVKVKITAHGDTNKATEKVGPKTKIALLQADRGDSKKQTLRSVDKVTVPKNKHDKTNSNTKTQPQQKEKSQPHNLKLNNPDPWNDKDEFIDVDSTIEAQIKQVLKVKELEKEKKIKLTEELNNKQNSRVIAAKERKRIRDKYTIRPKISAEVKQLQPTVNDCYEEINQDKNLSDKDTKSISTRTKDSQSIKKSEKSTRKPVITTVRCKNEKVYKTVAFADLKEREVKPIEIKLPTEIKDHEQTCEKNVESSSADNDKAKRKNRRKKKSHFPSPDRFIKGESPPTEVAKWAPSCVNKHTIPYYEAWVDTTLAAISKCSKTDKMLVEKQNLLKSFKKFLERPETPELVYDQMNEKYTGKITIRHRR